MMESTANTAREMEVQEKHEVAGKDEQTLEGRFYTPSTDIYEDEEALYVVMEVPGVDKGDIDVKLEKNQLSVEARISMHTYGNLKPVYTEFGVGHFARSFRLSNEIDQGHIKASLTDGVLTLRLPKVGEAATRRVEVA